MTWTNTFAAASRLVFDQTTGHHSLVKLTHKINQHSHLPETRGLLAHQTVFPFLFTSTELVSISPFISS